MRNYWSATRLLLLPSVPTQAETTVTSSEENAAIARRAEAFVTFPFNKRTMAWESYLYQLEQLFREKELWMDVPIAAAARREILLKFVGTDTLRLFSRHFYPENYECKSYEALKQAAEHLYQDTVPVFTSRAIFSRAERRQNETFTSFADRLWELIAPCEYGQSTDDQMRDRFVIGANHQRVEAEIRQRWPTLRESNHPGAPFITFHSVYHFALSLELAEEAQHWTNYYYAYSEPEPKV